MSDSLHDLHRVPACHEPVTFLREEAAFVVVHKPAGLLSVPGRHPDNRDCVISRVQIEYPGASAVHRLDLATSGLMVVPVHKRALSHIGKQFQNREVEKTYIAVVAGQVVDDSGEVDLPIAPDREQRPRYKIDPAGKASVTRYEVIERDAEANTTRLRLYPVTGRSHQLRLHMQAIGHPILGCEFYADSVTRERAERLLLHAARLSFRDPDSGSWVTTVSEPDF